MFELVWDHVAVRIKSHHCFSDPLICPSVHSLSETSRLCFVVKSLHTGAGLGIRARASCVHCNNNSYSCQRWFFSVTIDLILHSWSICTYIHSRSFNQYRFYRIFLVTIAIYSIYKWTVTFRITLFCASRALHPPARGCACTCACPSQIRTIDLQSHHMRLSKDDSIVVDSGTLKALNWFSSE